MQKLLPEQKKFLEKATSQYHKALEGSPAEEYLQGRGLGQATKFRLGYVQDPLPGHEKYQGYLSIPYLRYHKGWSCIGMRFRALDPEIKPKYLSTAGSPPHLYNTVALLSSAAEVGISEGELDAISATLTGIPTVGVPGANIFQQHWYSLFAGFKTVWVFADGDDPGHEMAYDLTKHLNNARVIYMPQGEDVNSYLSTHTPEEFTNLRKGQ